MDSDGGRVELVAEEGLQGGERVRAQKGKEDEGESLPREIEEWLTGADEFGGASQGPLLRWRLPRRVLWSKAQAERLSRLSAADANKRVSGSRRSTRIMVAFGEHEARSGTSVRCVGRPSQPPPSIVRLPHSLLPLVAPAHLPPACSHAAPPAGCGSQSLLGYGHGGAGAAELAWSGVGTGVEFAW